MASASPTISTHHIVAPVAGTGYASSDPAIASLPSESYHVATCSADIETVYVPSPEIIASVPAPLYCSLPSLISQFPQPQLESVNNKKAVYAISFSALASITDPETSFSVNSAGRARQLSVIAADSKPAIILFMSIPPYI